MMDKRFTTATALATSPSGGRCPLASTDFPQAGVNRGARHARRLRDQGYAAEGQRFGLRCCPHSTSALVEYVTHRPVFLLDGSELLPAHARRIQLVCGLFKLFMRNSLVCRYPAEAGKLTPTSKDRGS